MIISVFCLTACIPLQQTNIVGGGAYDHFGYYGDSGYGLLQIGPSNVPKTISVVDAQSYAIAPDGSRLGVKTEPHAWDIEFHPEFRTPYVRDCVRFFDANGDHISLNDGSWKFHFTIRTPKGVETRDFHGELWTFYYNPIVHGPPN